MKKFRVVLQKYGVLGFSRISEIILLKKNPWNRFTAAWTRSTGPAHDSTSLMKRRSLATGSTTRIKPSESLFLDLISTADLEADGYDGFVLDLLAPAKSGMGKHHGRRWWGAPSSPYATSFSKPKAPRRWEVSVLTTYRARRWTTDSRRRRGGSAGAW
jgi:hypothetical protein